MVAANDNHNDRLAKLYELMAAVNEPAMDIETVRDVLRGLLEEAISVRTGVRDGIDSGFF